MSTNLELAEHTPPGMAHYAGTGPDHTHCASCKHFMGKPRPNGPGAGTLQPGRCAQFIRMMGRKRAPVFRIQPSTPSCRHYQATP
jgi:hypothetical protein